MEDSDLEGPSAQERSYIGRFRIIRQLGKGGFGFVYLAEDPSLNRQVAIKVPRWDRPLTHHGIERFQIEGRMLAQVNHPSIVSVYDVASTDDRVPFVVMEYISGDTLSNRLKNELMPHAEAIQFLLAIAEALKQAHKSGLVHRDFKPGNVIIKENGAISLVDFGLALHDDLSSSEIADKSIAGTPSYMSPEQIRGENHLLGGQTDIWAFGVTMYRMLTGVLPFKGNHQELSQSIRYKNPRPLRQRQEQIPRQLERICLRCLQKLMEDRYQSMADLIEELESYQSETNKSEAHDQIDLSTSQSIRQIKQLTDSTRTASDSTSQSGTPRSKSDSMSHSSSQPSNLNLVPKGLRSFDQNDREFFLRLLPGPTDRHGIPESIRFWIARLGQTDQVDDVNIGIIYGPSGCGKSSFVRAGLIPRLPETVIPIYIDCTQENLTHHIVKQLQQNLHSIPADVTLIDLLRNLRRGQYLAEGDKVLLILDQFEQWLNGDTEYGSSALTNALRQCDSHSVQSLLLVRDEFWLSASQFMKCLGQRIEESRNAMALPLFDQRHARQVLQAFGRAYDRLPHADQRLNSQQRRFIKEAVASLANRGKVICVHLAVFAETAKNQAWNYAEFKSVGGWEGIGREYISATFSAPETPGYIKKNSQDAWAILRQLLPDNESELKGRTVGKSAIRNNAGLADQTTKFDQLLGFLESDSNLISAFENTEAIERDTLDQHAPQEKLYGLTHDFLVKPIRGWGMLKQNETRQGRADQTLANLSDQWAATDHARYLPSGLDFFRILWHASPSLKKQKSNFWRLAKRRTQKLASLVGIASILVLTLMLWLNASTTRSERVRITQNYLNVDPGHVEENFQLLSLNFEHVSQELTNNLSAPNAKNRARAAAALLSINPDDHILRDVLVSELETVKSEELNWFVNRLALDPHKSMAALSRVIDSNPHGLTPRLAVTSAALGSSKWLNQITRLSGQPRQQLNTVDELAACDGLIPQLLESLTQTPTAFDKDAVYSFCVALSFVEVTNLSDKTKSDLETYLKNLYLNSKDGSIHVASLYVLTRWNSTIPEITGPGSPAHDWCEMRFQNTNSQATPHRVLMVKIPQGSYPQNKSPIPHTGRVKNDFWIATVETTDVFYQQFHLERYQKNHFEDYEPFDEKNRRATGPFNLEPAQYLHPQDCHDFATWLNEHDGQITWINRPAELAQLEFGVPSPDQFELATRAHSETEFFFGTAKRASQYLGKNINTFGLTSGQFPPNGFGLHDITGNLTEWTNHIQPSNTVGRFRYGAKGFGDEEDVGIMGSAFAIPENPRILAYTGGMGFRFVLRVKEKEKAQPTD
jgi:serine/threonine protein kinase